METIDSSSPTTSEFLTTNTIDYITVVSVGSNESTPKIEQTSKQKDGKDYITVLKIGSDDQLPQTITEEVLVYRLPGEKLGFGLKFEGGTKSAEFVKRLFIQSCAINSPASRVESLWGSLVEGDEVIEIDSVPVNTMTRIDCVRCLKDSNVVIKLLIKHRFDEKNSETNMDETRSRSIEDLPLVISAEKKRTPPPPPPVPPRKVNRKSKENIANIVIPPKGFGDCSGESNTSKQSQEIGPNIAKNHRLQSPYNSFRKQRQSPEVIKRVRRVSDDINCPPDAEVYIDLFSQESAYSLSESDDTGSSISTIVDKLGSYPATTNSSFAGSLPSTPTPIQRHIYLTENFDFSNENYLFSKLITSQAHDEDEIPEDLILEKDTYQKASEMSSNEGTPLQPPANFQDAPLSYGNEDVKIIKSELRINLDIPTERKRSHLIEPEAPSPPPRTRSQNSQEKSKTQIDEDVVDAPELPRLVDFVPKSSKNSPVREVYAKLNSIEILRRFLENEKYDLDYITMDDNKNHIKNYELDISIDSTFDDNSWGEESQFFSLDWSPSSKLATIGEDEEEIIQENECYPLVVIENADVADETCEKCVKEEDDNYKEDGVEEKIVKEVPIRSSKATSIPSLTQGVDVDEIMDGPRQPPDGHEFPDQEKQIEKKMPIIEPIVEKPPPIKPRDSWWSKREPQANSVRDKIAIFSKPQTTLTKKYLSTSSIAADSFTGRDKNEFKKATPSLFRNNSVIDSTSTMPKYRATATITPSDYKTQASCDPVILRGKSDMPQTKLHARSVSLLDINDNSNKLDRWSLLIEQRRLSKLKGLVIPEHEPDTDGSNQPFVDLPEIQSIITPVITRDQSSTKEAPLTRRHSSSVSNLQLQQTKESATALPKYSPAFKRRSFQIHPSNNTTVPNDLLNFHSKSVNVISNKTIPTIDDNKTDIKKTLPPVKTRDFSNYTVSSALSDPPKSLESITSPTRSDYSFEFNNIPQIKSPGGELKLTSSREKLATPRSNSYVSDIVASSEYDSDTDSALSSSQSSYLSKTSPPASPIHIRGESINDVQKKMHLSLQTETPAYESKRLLKPQSLEAINRKNILASAKCRSGRDLKVGSPLIRRKFEDNEVSAEEPKPLPNGNVEIKPVAIERQSVKENPVVDANKEIAPKSEELQSQSNSEIVSVPKVALRDTQNTFVEKPVEPSKRNFATSGYYSQNNPVVRRASSVTDLRKNFEKNVPTPAKRNSINSIMTTSTPIQPQPIKRTSLPHITPLISSKVELHVKSASDDENVKSNSDELIEDTLKHFDEDIPKSDVKIVRLKPDVDGGSIGITLAGGADYETKEITIHKIRGASPAFRDGKLLKGDKILAINGKYMKGLSHAQSLKILKENVPEVIIIACKGSESNNVVTSPKICSRQISFDSTNETTASKDDLTIEEPINNTTGAFEVSITKDATGVGFSIHGGRGSPQGDIPIVIKKIFMGGAAEKAVNLKAGDEILEINHIDVTSMSRMEAWNVMKKLPEQEVIIKVRR